MNYQEQELALEFNKGNEAAFAQVYNSLYHPLLLFTRSFVPTDDAADIVSDSFIKIFKRHAYFNSLADIKAFLYITARNACFDYLRHQKVKSRQQLNIEQLSREDEGAKVRAEIEAELIGLIRSKMEDLPARQNEVLTLAYFEGYSNKDIAEKLKINDQTVRNLKSSALHKIRTSIFDKQIQSSLVALSMAIINFFLQRLF